MGEKLGDHCYLKALVDYFYHAHEELVDALLIELLARMEEENEERKTDLV